MIQIVSCHEFFPESKVIDVPSADVLNTNSCLLLLLFNTKRKYLPPVPSLKYTVVRGEGFKSISVAITQDAGVVEHGKRVYVRHYVRNIGKQRVSFDYSPRNFSFLYIAVGDGKWQDGRTLEKMGLCPRYRVVLEPGEEWDFSHPGERWNYDGGFAFAVHSPGKPASKLFVNSHPRIGPGKYRVRFSVPGVDRLSHVMTGETTLVVK